MCFQIVVERAHIVLSALQKTSDTVHNECLCVVMDHDHSDVGLRPISAEVLYHHYSEKSGRPFENVVEKVCGWVILRKALLERAERSAVIREIFLVKIQRDIHIVL